MQVVPANTNASNICSVQNIRDTHISEGILHACICISCLYTDR